MKDSGKSKAFVSIELWIAITLFVFGVLYFLAFALGSDPEVVQTAKQSEFSERKLPFDFYRNYLYPELARAVFLFGIFMLLNFRVVPRLLQRKNLKVNLPLIGISVVAAVAVNFCCNYFFYEYLRSDADGGMYILLKISISETLTLLWIFAGHCLIKYSGLYALEKAERIERSVKIFNHDNLIGLIFLALLVYYLVRIQIKLEILSTVVPIGLSIILLHGYSFYKLLPLALRKKWPLAYYLLRVFFLAVMAYFVVLVVLIVATGEADLPAAIAVFNSFFQFFIVAPILFALYRNKVRGAEELYALKKELGNTEADLDFLRSQINPHFLFNALNTIYATAISEKAVRTSESVEMLGEMMRFMLHENSQERIDLRQEVEYLKNYIRLQTLRTVASPEIQLETNLEAVTFPALKIAPMLLIPFVENAFKHGVSLLEKSHIRIGLEYTNHFIYFKVYNTRHHRNGADPETNHSGIGLRNVRQRLELLYQGRHTLDVKKTDSDFSVELSLDLRDDS